MKNILIRIVSICALVAVLYGVSQAPRDSASLNIGVAAALTGGADEWGQGELRATQMVVDEANAAGGVNGQQIKLVVQDTLSDNKGTVNAVAHLINIDRVPLILGPTWGDSYFGGNVIAQKARVVLLSPSTAIESAEADENLDYHFSTWWPMLPEVQALQSYMQQHGVKKVALLRDEDAYTTNVAELFVASAAQSSLTVIDQVKVPVGTSDFRTNLVKLKQKNPDGFVVLISDLSQLGPFLKQAKELGVTVPTFATASSQNTALLADYAQYMESLVYTYPKTIEDDTYKQVVADYTKKYGQAPSSPSFVNAYNAAQAVVEVLKTGARTSDEIKAALYKLQMPGVGLREVSFNEKGQIGTADFEIKTVRHGQFTTVTK